MTIPRRRQKRGSGGHDLDGLLRDLEAFREGRSQSFENSHRLQHEDGSYRWMQTKGVALRGASGEAVRLSGSLTSLQQQGIFDPLTGLPNRTLLHDRLTRAFEAYGRNPERTFALLFIDLDRFKMINDSLGHRVGDLLLIELARRLQLCVRTGDTVARLGGDEFVVLLEDIKDYTVMQIVSRIERYTTATFELEGHQVVSGASVRIVGDLSGYTSTEDILRDADIAMYHAKKERLPYAFFSPHLLARVVSRQQDEIDLRRALERSEFFLEYQPIVSLHSGEVNGLEALVRWQHPTRGVLSPQAFIPLAEETRLITTIGEWVLSEACHQMSAWTGGYAQHQRQLIDQTAFAARPGRARGAHLKRERPRPRPAAFRDYRNDHYGGHGAGERGTFRPTAARPAAGYRRFRNRLLVFGVPAPPTFSHGKDRPLVYPGDGRRPQKFRGGPHRDLDGAESGPRGRFRGRRIS